MKHIITICISILLTPTLYAQLANADAFFDGSYDKKYVRDNKIKQITVDIKMDGKRSTFYIFDFDKKGLLKKQTILNSLRNKINDYFFKYNNYQDQIERRNIDYELKKEYKTTFSKEYNNFLLIKEKASDLPFGTNYLYNSKRQKIEAVKYLGLDTINSAKQIFFYNYDPKGKLNQTKEVLINLDGLSNVIGITSYKYDTNGRIVAVQKNNSSMYVITYDKKGFIESTTFKMSEEFSGLEFVDKYNYSFWR